MLYVLSSFQCRFQKCHVSVLICDLKTKEDLEQVYLEKVQTYLLQQTQLQDLKE